MKGVILAINPRADVIDVTHAIPPQDIAQGAWALLDVAESFPPGTIHVAVVDPGVGGARRIVYAEIAQRHYIAPDNGLLGRLAARTAPSRIIALTEPQVLAAERFGDISRSRHHGSGRREVEPGAGAGPVGAKAGGTAAICPERR